MPGRTSGAKVLLVDDEPGVLFTLKEVLLDRGHQPVATSSPKDALGMLDGVQAALVDFSMPEMNGLELLRAIHDRDESLPVILLTAHGSERVAVAAMKAGAHDYLTKPFDIDEVALAIERAIEVHRLRVSNRRLEAEQAIGRKIVGESPAMRRLLDGVARVAGKDITVLVRGETGTGKELIGTLLHAQSKRANGPLVRFNCAAIPGDLAEAELFGHAKGAFTGASGARRGFFAQADHGTLILDEIGELSLGVQAKLLRAIQEGEIQPVGSGRIEKVDVRIVAATNRDLLAEARAGRFREDLYYRLAVVEVVVPRLVERREDIPALAEEFARRYGDKFGVAQPQLSPRLIERLAHADWPGNVRQLENTIARLVALAQTDVIDVDAFDAETPPAITPSSPDVAAVAALAQSETGTLADGPSLKEQVEAFERSLIARVLSATGGNQSEAARRLSTSRATLIDKLRKYGLSG
jgi:two-component system response regulator AtoC